MRKLEWLVVKDNWLTETANFWKNAPEVKNGEVKTADIKTEVFFFPATQVAEIEGTFTNTQRMLQFHSQSRRGAGRLPLRYLVHLPARQAPEEALRATRRCRATRDLRTWSGTTSTRTKTSARRASLRR